MSFDGESGFGRSGGAALTTGAGDEGLRVARTDEGDVITLHLVGFLSPDGMAALRETAFTAIGARPRLLQIDLRDCAGPMEIAAINTLVTISRVARLAQVRCSVFAPPFIAAMLRATNLGRALPFAEVPRARTRELQSA